jgi:hypothetical protein
MRTMFDGGELLHLQRHLEPNAGLPSKSWRSELSVLPPASSRTMPSSSWVSTRLVKSWPRLTGILALQALRVLLGIAEGGVLPALALLLSRFYTRSE